MEISDMTIKKTRELLGKKEVSASELVSYYIANIEKENKDLNAYLSVFNDDALKQAKKIDERIEQGEEIGLLGGIPVAIKDNILVEGKIATAGSKILENYISAYDATVVSRLEAAGAIILGKTNLDEFAMGSSCEQSAFGPTKNPRDRTYVPGGSSGGSACAVAGDMAMAALGSDTGGSIRQPASFCGIVGLKPTYGRVSRFGLMAMASSLDQIGPMAKNVYDAALIFSVISGQDENDATSVDITTRTVLVANRYEDSPRRKQDIKNGLPQEHFIKGLDPAVEKVIK